MKSYRIYLLLIFVTLVSAAIISRLVFLQVLKYEFYKALNEGQQKILQEQTGKRGEIFFRDGEPLAVNRSGKYVFASPKEIKEKEETAKILSQILELDYEFLLMKIKKSGLFEPLKHRLSLKEEQELREKNLPGIYLEGEVFRYYPQQNIASQVVGFLGGEERGQYGVEGFYDEFLKGKEVLSEKERGPAGFLGFTNIGINNQGADIFLTLDYNIQFMAESLLLKAKETLGFQQGEVLVLEPFSGKILALAQIPNFDPNLYFDVKEPEIFQNASLQKIFEPGSVFKPIIMAAALNEDKIEPQTSYIDKGLVEIGGSVVYNYDRRVWGQKTMTEVLEKSINTGAVFAERQLGHTLFLEYLKRFGFFEKTGIDLQGEVFSENKEFKKGYEINFATASFGQGIEISSMQLAGAFAAISNGGKLVRPRIVEKIFKDGKEINTENKFEPKEVISEKTASQLTAMLVSVVENGFGKAAGIDGYYIAGKTGTAQVSWPALGLEKSGYSPNTIQTFVGFAPAFEPQFLILVKLNNPKTKTAEYSAVPIFRDLAKYIIDWWEIPPKHE